MRASIVQKRVETDALDAKCASCNSAVLLESGSKQQTLSRSEFEALPPGVWRYISLLPSIADNNIVTLGEGTTPLLPAKRLGSELWIG